MTLKFAHRIKESTATTGTGTYSLAGALTGFAAFSSFLATTETTVYCCTNNTDWEIGIGTFTSGAPATLARTQIIESSNANAAVNWSVGDKDIFCTQPSAIPNLFTADPVGSLTSPNSVTTGQGGVVLGRGNTHLGTNGTIIGTNSTILGSVSNCITLGKDAVGGFSNSLVLSPGANSVRGDTQVTFKTAVYTTTDGFSYVLPLSLLPSGSNSGAVRFEIIILCRQLAGTGTIGAAKTWTFKGLTVFNAGAVSYQNISLATDSYTYGGLSTANVGTSSSVTPFTLTGETGKTLYWQAFAEFVEISNGTA